MCFNKLNVLFRGVAFAIDSVISTSLAMFVVALLMGEVSLGHNYLIIGIGISLLIIRDFFGKSVGKYLLGIDVLDAKSGTKAKWNQRLLKNITAPLSIIEIFMVVLRNDHKRIGDMIANTETRLNENSYALSIFQQICKK